MQIDSNPWRALLILALASTAAPASGPADRAATYRQQLQLAHRLFLDHQVFDLRGVRSALQCAGLCSGTDGCSSFTFGGSEGGSCRGHRVTLTDNAASVAADGRQTYSASSAVTSAPTNVTSASAPTPKTSATTLWTYAAFISFAMTSSSSVMTSTTTSTTSATTSTTTASAFVTIDSVVSAHTSNPVASSSSSSSSSSTTAIPSCSVSWLNQQTCSNHTYCNVINTGCYQGQCICTPGYYYSKSNCSCVEECPLASLQNESLLYKNYHIINNNYQYLTNYSLASCCSLCYQEPTCRSMEYRTNRDCSIAIVTPLQVPAASFATSSITDYYQRLCA